MIQLTPHMRILVAVEPVDFRKGIDGLRGLCRRFFDLDPIELSSPRAGTTKHETP